MSLGKRIVAAFQGFAHRDAKGLFDWYSDGLPDPPPQAVKWRVIDAQLKRFGIRRFIETGTLFGETLEYVARRGFPCTSVELSQDLYRGAKQKFSNYKNVELIHGDSGEVMPRILAQLREPTLFWLDGHYSHGITACGEKETPISEELAAILNHHIQRHVILIDDARCFNGNNDYPALHDLLHDVVEAGKYRYSVNCDVIQLVPSDGNGHPPKIEA